MCVFLQFLPSDREFYRAALIREVTGTVLPTTDEGLLSVIFVDRHTREKINRTVCADNFNWRTASTFCQYFGYRRAKWGSQGINKQKFVSQ